ncbi:MAG: D-alanine--D-alanine ligase [Chitinophaga sp.]|jgi:D-alanine-D-alanine ligase|nr:D-alanine--D-alanine ligase [Chitinophaga sp.]
MKKKIALVTGGYSGEAEISYKSAVTVGNNVDREKFDVYKIDINPNGWWYENEAGEKSAVNREDFTITINGSKIKFDAILLCIHGTPGEDGKLQGYFDMLGLPYTSCDAATSALTFNKRYTVAVAAFGGINVAKSMHLFKHTPVTPQAILQQLQLPVFVKPNNGGSSIGMSKVNEATELKAALDKAFKEDNQVLVEEFIKGREFTIGVFKNKGAITVLPITEIKTHKEFFDFEAKYQGKSEEVTPAQIADEMLQQLEAAAKSVYEVLNCRGIVRIDFIYSEKHNAPFMLEVNTVPGQSAASVVPQQVVAKGWTLKDFYTAVIEECL